jgi:hypothetical protein
MLILAMEKRDWILKKSFNVSTEINFSIYSLLEVFVKLFNQL